VPFRFFGQPFAGQEQAGEAISGALQDEAHDHAWFATAWAKRSGLSRLYADLKAFRARGGRAEVILGVDERGATTEGLELARELFDDAYVFHDPGNRTFHPKLYAIQNSGHACVVVGSGNLTRGGLYTNFEGLVVGDLDLRDADDRDFVDQMRAYYERLIALTDVCRPLTDAVLEDLKNDPTIVVSSESVSRGRGRGKTAGTSPVFGSSSVSGLLGAPPPEAPTVPADEDDDSIPPSAAGEGGEAAAGEGGEAAAGEGGEAAAGEGGEAAAGEGGEAAAPVIATLRWAKELTVSDAHRKPGGSHQRNYIVLTKAKTQIDPRTWFRHSLFGGLPWTSEPMRTGKTKEAAVVPFDVFVGQEAIGQRNLRIDHAEHRIANQNNSPTYLNWSSMLPVIESKDFTGWWLQLSLMSDGSYRLDLLSAKPEWLP
jgi:hypothetical protein